MDIQSRQAAGSLEWREASGAIAGQITARLKHLALGGEDGNKADEALSSNSDLSDIPAIDLQAKQFLLCRKNLGELQVLGTNLERGRRWRLDKLSIANDAAKLDAKGDWTLDGASRGLTVDAAIKFANLGGFMDRIGFEKMVSGGDGTMQGRMTWRNLPWTHNIADIDGEVEVSVDKGRFMRELAHGAAAGTAVAAIAAAPGQAGSQPHQPAARRLSVRHYPRPHEAVRRRVAH